MLEHNVDLFESQLEDVDNVRGVASRVEQHEDLKVDVLLLPLRENRFLVHAKSEDK